MQSQSSVKKTLFKAISPRKITPKNGPENTLKVTPKHKLKITSSKSPMMFSPIEGWRVETNKNISSRKKLFHNNVKIITIFNFLDSTFKSCFIFLLDKTVFIY